MDIGVLALILYAFFWGIRKGSVLCVVVCAPGLVPFVSETRCGWRRGAWMGIVFNIPRVILLTVIGMAVGVLFFTLGDVTGLGASTMRVGALGYVLVGCILAGYGLYNLAKALDERDRLAAGEAVSTPSAPLGEGLPHGRFSRWVAEKTCGARRGAFLGVWGGTLGLGCVGETLVTVELILIGGWVGIFATSTLQAAALGGAVMFFFSIGLSVPLVLLTAGSGALGEKVMNQKRMNNFRFASSLVMMAMGILVAAMALPRLLA